MYAWLYALVALQDKNVAGMIKLAERGIAFNAPDERSLEIVTRKKAYVLRAESSAEMAEWYNAFKVGPPLCITLQSWKDDSAVL